MRFVGRVLLLIALTLTPFNPLKAEAFESKEAYREMVAQQIVDAWRCIPATGKAKREDFMLSLIDRFAPEDRKTIEQGRIWKEALERKKKAGTLTVAEREQLASGYYYPAPDGSSPSQIDYSIKIQSGNFLSPRCEDEKRNGSWWQQAASVNDSTAKCELPYVDVTFRLNEPEDFKLIYEDQYSRWQLHGQNWLEAVDKEYEQLRRDRKLNVVSEYGKQWDRLQQEAKSKISNMPASQVAEGTEEKLIEENYRQLVCSDTP